VDEFQESCKKQEQEAVEMIQTQTRSGVRPCLEGLMRKLIHFRSQTHLERSIRQTFDVIDADKVPSSEIRSWEFTHDMALKYLTTYLTAFAV
jgi:hypothetical protein